MNLHSPTLRVLNILNTVAAHNGEFSMSDISRKVKIPRGTLAPIMYTLCHERYLLIDSIHKYSIGIRCFLSGNQFVNLSNSYYGIKSIITEIVNCTGETAHMCILDHGNVLYLIKVESNQAVRIFSGIGKELPAYSTAVGKALLSKMSFSELCALYHDGLIPVTENTITNINYLYEQLQKIKVTGYAYESEESTYGIRCIARPIYNPNGELKAAISVAIPIFRYNEEKRKLIEATLLESSEILSQIVDSLVP